MTKKFGKGFFMSLVLAFLYAPILILIVYSFTTSTHIGAIRGFSLQNYVTLFTTQELMEMIRGNVFLALGSAAI
ncbi:MAG: ABC transporter permease, partial [Clostridiales bacterium]|nr:ABC transporter permease [Clostridiales bacterium]